MHVKNNPSLGDSAVNNREATRFISASTPFAGKALDVRVDGTYATAGWRSQYVYRFCDRCQTLSDDISITKMIHNKNSSDLSWGTVPQSIAGEFLLWIILVIEISSLKV